MEDHLSLGLFWKLSDIMSAEMLCQHVVCVKGGIPCLLQGENPMGLIYDEGTPGKIMFCAIVQL